MENIWQRKGTYEEASFHEGLIIASACIKNKEYILTLWNFREQ